MDTIVDLQADGGTRRERGARLGALVRRYEREHGVKLTRLHIGYDEVYGFLPRTYARYKAKENVNV